MCINVGTGSHIVRLFGKEIFKSYVNAIHKDSTKDKTDVYVNAKLNRQIHKLHGK